MTRNKVRKNRARSYLSLLATGLFVAGTVGLVEAAPAAAQTGAIAGTILSAQTGEPLSAAQVMVEGTGLGTLTLANGRFLILRVPAGTYTVNAILIGYAIGSASVTVGEGQTATANMRLEPQAIALSEIVVTGTVGATQRTKLPFEVAQVNVRDLPVPNVNVGTALYGKVAGATVHQGSGRPGSAPSILLRGVTSIDANGRDQEPLYIVDGVILGSSLVDLDGLDIQSVEVVKGAAAASLYGSRAANGVIQIRTKRGAAMANDQVRYTMRSEYGQSALGSTPASLLSKHHDYAVTPDGRFILADGSTCVWAGTNVPFNSATDKYCTGRPTAAGNAPWRAASSTANDWNTIQTVAWPGQTYDQVKEFFETGDFFQNYVSAEGRAGATNFHVSVNNLQDGGVMPGHQGFKRTNLRVNVDQTMNERIQMQASALYSKSTQNDFPEGSGNPVFQLTRMPAGVDLRAEDPFEPGEIVLNADIRSQEQPNPFYEVTTRENTDDRSRFLGSLNLRYSPYDWVDLDLNGSFDRLDIDSRNYRPKGYRTINPTANTNDGNLAIANNLREAINASVTATFRRNLGDNIRNTTQLRYLYEDQFRSNNDINGYRFAVAQVPTVDNLDSETIAGGSSELTIRADGYFAITNFDIYDKYVVDALIRNDGSSLFGEDQRRQWYYRIAGAWRMSEENFFAVPGVDELKLRYSLGTAGGRPRFEAQYETYNVSGGRVTPVTLGNKDLKPEFSVEHEAGIDMSLFDNRVSLALTYARARTEDQILQVPFAAFQGFQNQWRNAGTIESKTYEASLDVRILDTEDFSWSGKILFDRSKSKITEMNLPAFQYGVDGQGLGSVFYAREGEEIGTFYGRMAASSCAHLPEGVSCDGFAINDDGYLVWVGTGGLTSNQWGTKSDVLIRGAQVDWGTPFIGECVDPDGERSTNCPLGNTIPDFNLNVAQTFTYKGINLYALVSHVNGFDVYNQPLQWAIFAGYAGVMDQSAVPAAQAKPMGYYGAGLYQGLGGLNPSSPFIEDATFTKLREVSLSYRFNSDQLGRIPGLDRLGGLAVSLTGRNLYTWTDYRGYDPEVGKSGGDTGSSAIARVEGYQYPNFRTWTAALELIF